MISNNHGAFFTEAANALYTSLTPAQQSLTRTLGKMHTGYIGSHRDRRLNYAFEAMILNSAAELFGRAGKRRILLVVGAAGSGKTTAVRRHIAKRPQFGSRTTVNGELRLPFVHFESPKPMTLKGLAKAGLAALDYEVDLKSVNEQEIFDLWKEQLRENRVLFLWIDEFQHSLQGNTTKAVQNVSDVLKSLTQMEGYPLHLVVSGVPELANLLHQSGDSDGQLKERSRCIELRPMSASDDAKTIKKIVKKIVTADAGLKALDLGEDDFTRRLLHACNYAFGSTIQMVRSACEYALTMGMETVSSAEFAECYALATGCRPSENVFTEPQWSAIVPNNALGKLLSEFAPHLEERARRHRKTPGEPK
ncbi:hypothetical protein ASC97_31935 [Rhizobium sp. Root1203]|uniref:ATP-binding protein n=1 Tax=Rhizobium sp. Root1203 TaxID=1736427 RepID=UPI00070CAAC9|nr:ATP-binding protein [Rhizobium sp. Root1203]KQV13720.1 hypothetical protein ASC97_31935 [Rhizobium sp. Root1203]